MELLYTEEHLDCMNYDNGNKPFIEVKELDRERVFDELPNYSKIIIIREGSLTDLLGNISKDPVGEKKMLFLPSGKQFKFTAHLKTKIVILRIKQPASFCNCYSMEKLKQQAGSLFSSEEESAIPETAHLLRVNQAVGNYVEGLCLIMGKGAHCKKYFELKIKELFYLFRMFYKKEELALFFKDILSADAGFSFYVMQNYRKYKTATAFAASMNMTLQSFEKKFKKVFELPPYRWMKQRKADDIFQDICAQTASFKELAAKYGFATKSSFHKYCVANLHGTPGEIRKKCIPRKNGKQIK